MIPGFILEGESFIETNIDVDMMTPNNVLCIVYEKIIYLWIGSQAGVRPKFISARRASDLRNEYGPTYKMQTEDEGQETEGFLTAITTTHNID